MDLEFHDILSGKGIGSRKKQGYARIDDFAAGIIERPVMGMARAGCKADETFSNTPGLRTGNPDDADAAAA